VPKRALANATAPYLPALDSRTRRGDEEEYRLREDWKNRRAAVWRDVWVTLRRGEPAFKKALVSERGVDAMFSY
jgi:hypothetical protein